MVLSHAYHRPLLPPAPPLPAPLAAPARGLRRWLHGWWRLIHLAALLLALALSPSSYAAGHRRSFARHLWLGTAPTLLPFVVLSTLICLVLIRIVVVTAASYGLTQYALEMVVRVLVLELIPLTAALFAALRCTIPQADQISALRRSGRWDALRAEGLEPLRREALPRATAGIFCALLLAAASAVIGLVVAYLTVHGFTTAALPSYTRTVGQVFTPAVTLVFALKALLLALAVALLPLAAVLDEAPRRRLAASAELQGLVRMFVVIVLVEAAALVGNYH